MVTCVLETPVFFEASRTVLHTGIKRLDAHMITLTSRYVLAAGYVSKARSFEWQRELVGSED